MRNLAPLLFALALPLHAEYTSKPAVATALPVATFEELAAQQAPPSLNRDREREHPRARRGVPPAVAPQATTAPPASLTAPPLGLRFLDEADSSMIYPADASGAVGLTRVVGVNNKSIWLHDRTGKPIGWAYLSAFFSTSGTFDPRIVYDPQFDRWVIAALRDDGPPSYANSRLLIGLSDTNDPMGAWHRFIIPVDQSNALSLDFTQLALSRDNILITANLYSGDVPLGSQVYVIPRASAYTAVTTLPSTVGTVQQLQYLTPVAVYDPDNASDWIINVNGSYLNVLDATNGADVTSYNVDVDLFRICPSPPAQLGSSQTMDLGWPDLHYALIRNHKLWGVVNRSDTCGTPLSILAFRVDLSLSTVSLWNIESADTAYTFPSIAVNRRDEAVVAFSAFNAKMYPSAAFTYIAPDGRWSTPSVLKSGEGPYGIPRWGDFTTTVVDPVDGITFWTTQVIALAPVSSSTWSTWWTQIPMNGPLRHHAAHH